MKPTENNMLSAGAFLWWCCRRRRRQQQASTGKWQLPKEEAASGPSWAASTGSFLSRPFRIRAPPTLGASTSIDMSPATEDPEKPPFDSFTAQGLHQSAPEGSGPPMHTFTSQLEKQDLNGAVTAGPAVVTQQTVVDKGTMSHSNSAVSLPGSNASSLQGPATPIAPPVISGSFVDDNSRSSSDNVTVMVTMIAIVL